MKFRETTVAIRACRNPRCQRSARIRGLCGSCYMAAYRLVADEAVSWKELEDAGKVNEQKRAAKNWLLEGINS